MSKQLFEDQQQTALSYLDGIAEGVEQGREDALYQWYVLGEIEKKVKEVKSLVKPHALHESDGQEKTFEHQGLKFERRNGASRWSFKSIPEWNEKKEELKEIEAECKARFQSYSRGKETIDPETGESLPLPTVTYSEDSLIVK